MLMILYGKVSSIRLQSCQTSEDQPKVCVWLHRSVRAGSDIGGSLLGGPKDLRFC